MGRCLVSNDYLVPFDGEFRCSRRHALAVFAAAGGLVVTRPFARALATDGWGDPSQSTMVDADGKGFRLAGGLPYEKPLGQSHPTLALDPSGSRLWTTWTRSGDRGAEIDLRSFSIPAMQWEDVHPVSADEAARGAAHESEIASVGDRLVIVWAAYTADGWKMFSRAFDPASGVFGACHQLSGGSSGVRLHPAIAAAGDRAFAIWQETSNGKGAFEIVGRAVGADGAPVGEVVHLSDSPEKDCCHAAIGASPDGDRLAVVFDRQDAPGTQNIYVVLIGRDGSRQSDLMRASVHPATDILPAMTFSPDGKLLWVAWQTNRDGTAGWDIPRWYEVRALKLSDNTWHQPAGAAQTRKPTLGGTDQGFECARLAISPWGTVCVLGRPSHNFCVQYYGKDGASPLYRLPKDGWGGRGKWMRGVFDSSGALWATRRDLSTNVLHRIDGFDQSIGAPVLEPVDAGNSSAAAILSGVCDRYEWQGPSSDDGLSGFECYIGDIHSHSRFSDGMGEPEECYLRARDVFHDDFHVLTDHDRFVGKPIMPGQWQELKDVAEHYHADGQFVTFFGQEWTTPRVNGRHGWGHYIIYSPDPTIPLFDHGDPRYRDLPDMLEAVRPYRAIAIPHHIGWTGVRWDVWDPEVIAAVEICSVHGAFEYEGNEPIRHRGGMKGSFVRDGLAAGRRFAIVGGCDQHGLIWHHGVCWKRNCYRAGLTGVWAKERTRDAILDAIHQRRTFATTGVKLCPRFAINGHPIGSEIEVDGPPNLWVDVAIPYQEGRLRWIEIIRDGTVINSFGGEDQQSRYPFTDEQCPRGKTSYYYVRVTLEDRNLAWTSPIWVTRA